MATRTLRNCCVSTVARNKLHFFKTIGAGHFTNPFCGNSSFRTRRQCQKNVFERAGRAARLILVCDPALFCFIKAMTIRALEKEVLELPPKSRARFAEKIIESIDDYAGPEIEKAWTQEIGRRVEEIKSGKAKGIPAEEAMTKARRALHETRRLSPARR